MSQYTVRVTVSTYMAHFIEVDAANEDEAERLARDAWYDYGSEKFRSSCIQEEVEDIEVVP